MTDEEIKICGYHDSGFCIIHKERTDSEKACDGLKKRCQDYWVHTRSD